ncbi:carboxypeptidase-like regulatory domain-containing protein [Flavobacterium sp. UBA7682]|uniref:carboxypeptidase-like regulatory domain-containing protein n=1 Tax=Flavobacterium sp. UBA7682 TaxID=1946560 RepID=UPI0025C249AB|nr:carboxypeptidase-like regulatory domain-containing protein [Flavobacterium sp. UBA7682]
MTNKINISIPQPCHENWEAMTAVDKGKFCASCQKKVHDFSKVSDREIVTAFQQNKNLCGRFLNTQLERDLVKPNEKSSIWLATTVAVISLIGIGTNEVNAQEAVKTEQTDRRILGKFIVEPKPEEIEVSGIVSDETGPLPGANVTIKGTTFSTQTDFDGKYSIKVQKDSTLIISFTGYEQTEVIIADKYDYNTQLHIETKLKSYVMGLLKRRTFFGRTFHAIGNWFR